MNPSFRESGAFDSFVSVAAFVLLDRFAGLPWAIAGATAWSLKATYTKHRKHQRIGWLLPATTLYLIFRGTVGIITDSRAAYFGVGIGTKFAIGLGLIGSVVIGKGVAAMYADRVLPFPDDVRVHGIFRSTMNQLTVLAGLYEMGSAGSDIWLYNHSSKPPTAVKRSGSRSSTRRRSSGTVTTLPGNRASTSMALRRMARRLRSGPLVL